MRIRQPRIGGKKLYCLLKADFERLDFKLGRDRFFALLEEKNLLVRRKKRRCKTTDSSHEHPVYPNLIAGLKLYRPFQAVASDITYIRLEEGFCYLSLITDLFSRVIVGWCLSETLDATGPVTALKEARLFMGRHASGSIHHSDQGVIHCPALPPTHLPVEAPILFRPRLTPSPSINSLSDTRIENTSAGRRHRGSSSAPPT